MVRARQMEGRFAFWLTLIGYNRRDKSLSHRLYLVYALVFMSFWVFAVFTLLAGSGANLLKALNPLDPAFAAERLSFLAVILRGSYLLVKFSRRSPFIFTEDDAYLICQTPIDRRAVAVSWFPADWLESALPFMAIMVTLGFSLAEIGLHGQATVLDIPAYVMMGLRAMILFLPLHLGILALLWAIGAFRLHLDEDPTWLRWAALLAVIILLGGVLLSLVENGFNNHLASFWQVIYMPISFPLTAAFGQAHWLPGLGLGVLWSVIGLVALWFTSRDLNLSRAAQEGRGQAAKQQALRTGAFEQANAIAQKDRLGIGHASSRLRGYGGDWSLPWKDVVQAGRDFRLVGILPWFFVFLAALGIALLPGWAPRALMTAIWCIAVGQAVTYRLRNDLTRWSILRQLPIPPDRLVISDLILPWMLRMLVTWLALASGIGHLEPLGVALWVLVPPASASVVALAAYDIFRQCQVSALMAGSAGEVSARGALLAIVAVMIPFGLVAWLDGQGLLLPFSLLLGFAASIGLAMIGYLVAVSAMENIE